MILYHGTQFTDTAHAFGLFYYSWNDSNTSKLRNNSEVDETTFL